MKLTVEGLSVRYGATQAIEAVDLTAHPGEVLAVIGPNGSGKSSLVKAIAGLVKHEGVVSFDGSPMRPERIGYMPQDIGARAALTVLEAVLLGRLGRLGLRVRPEDLAAVEAVLGELDLMPLASRYLGELSGGQRQLVFLAQALASEPALLLLDEPISALDIRHQLDVLAIVLRMTRARSLTTLVILHDLNIAARFADAVMVMRQGRVVCCGQPGAVIDERMVAAVFGVEAALSSAPDGRLIVTPLRAL
ncbi:ABC transporter ATP-binding protein [Bosea sp. (in: a-proteobacteria)]|uniref:ABC transporter ATP-binding protein n=1 Tax=Bosea sp. (in: a-proteobacteria) TaxID=1871050 RepID=UPI0027349D56|nr:ABC transporter ATP-binding protein [Bosea sp. (in: a-proteobacteria)]MDP3411437.1 ABC transporter ATP-binding protein [Bosea sp. (in: a-proteobacteria)]